jgi:predicted amidohydrolase
MARNVHIAACQFAARPVGSFDEFAENARGLLDQAGGAELVLLPELFTRWARSSILSLRDTL